MTGKWRLLVYGAASLGQSILLCAPASAFNTSQHGYSSALAIAGAGEDAADIRKFGGVIQKWSGGLCTLNPDKLRCTPAEELAHANDQRANFCNVEDNGGPFGNISKSIVSRYAENGVGNFPEEKRGSEGAYVLMGAAVHLIEDQASMPHGANVRHGECPTGARGLFSWYQEHDNFEGWFKTAGELTRLRGDVRPDMSYVESLKATQRVVPNVVSRQFTPPLRAWLTNTELFASGDPDASNVPYVGQSPAVAGLFGKYGGPGHTDIYLDFHHPQLYYEQGSQAADFAYHFLLNMSKSLPPLLGELSFCEYYMPNGQCGNKRGFGGGRLGSNSGTYILLQIAENRASRVYVDAYVKEGEVKYPLVTSGAKVILDGTKSPLGIAQSKDLAGELTWNTVAVDLLPTSDTNLDLLPFKSELRLSFDGRVQGATLSEGRHDFCVVVRDLDGNVSEERCNFFTLDKEGPAWVACNTTPISTDGNFQIEARDALSGVQSITVETVDGRKTPLEQPQPAASVTQSIGPLASGNHRVTLRDAVGNSTDCTLPVERNPVRLRVARSGQVVVDTLAGLSRSAAPLPASGDFSFTAESVLGPIVQLEVLRDGVVILSKGPPAPDATMVSASLPPSEPPGAYIVRARDSAERSIETAFTTVASPVRVIQQDSVAGFDPAANTFHPRVTLEAESPAQLKSISLRELGGPSGQVEVDWKPVSGTTARAAFGPLDSGKSYLAVAETVSGDLLTLQIGFSVASNNIFSGVDWSIPVDAPGAAFSNTALVSGPSGPFVKLTAAADGTYATAVQEIHSSRENDRTLLLGGALRLRNPLLGGTCVNLVGRPLAVSTVPASVATQACEAAGPQNSLGVATGDAPNGLSAETVIAVGRADFIPGFSSLGPSGPLIDCPAAEFIPLGRYVQATYHMSASPAEVRICERTDDPPAADPHGWRAGNWSIAVSDFALAPDTQWLFLQTEPNPAVAPKILVRAGASAAVSVPGVGAFQFSDVATPGELTARPGQVRVPAGFVTIPGGAGTILGTDATFSSVEITLNFDPALYHPSQLAKLVLLHITDEAGGAFEDITIARGPSSITGRTMSFSPFVIALPTAALAVPIESARMLGGQPEASLTAANEGLALVAVDTATIEATAFLGAKALEGYTLVGAAYRTEPPGAALLGGGRLLMRYSTAAISQADLDPDSALLANFDFAPAHLELPPQSSDPAAAAISLDLNRGAGMFGVFARPRDRNAPTTRLAVSGPSFTDEAGRLFVSTSSALGFIGTDSGTLVGLPSGFVQAYFKVDPSPSLLAGGLDEGTAGLFDAFQTSVTLAGGSRTIAFGGVDVSGNFEGLTVVDVFVDDSPPASLLLVDNEPAPSQSGGLIILRSSAVAFAAVDPGAPAAGPGGIEYSLDGGAWLDFEEALGGFSTGTHLLRFRAVDLVENREAVREVTLDVRPFADATPPLTRASVTGARYLDSEGREFLSTGTLVTLRAFDPFGREGPPSGIAEIRYSLDGTSSTGGLVRYERPFSLLEGPFNLGFGAVDEAGNAEVLSSSRVFVDATSPLTDVAVEGPSAFGPAGEVFIASSTMLALVSTDPVSNAVNSGVAATLFLLDPGPEFCGLSPEALPVAVSTAPQGSCANPYFIAASTLAAGEHHVAYLPVDNVGNLGLLSTAVIHVDVESPDPVTDLAAPGADESSLTVSWTAPNDAVAGVGAYQLWYATVPFDESTLSLAHPVRDPPDPLPAGARQTAVVDGLEPGTPYYLAVLAVDRVGNSSSLSLPIAATTRLPDHTPPETQLSLAGFSETLDGVVYLSTATSLSLMSLDPAPPGQSASGVAAVYSSVDPDGQLLSAGLHPETTAFFTVSSAPFTLAEGSRTVTFGARDRAGNYETAKVSSFVVVRLEDLEPPETTLVVLGTSAVSGSTVYAGAGALFRLEAFDRRPLIGASGVRETRIVVDGIETAYFGPFALASGSHVLSFASTDNAGNVETPRAVTIVVPPGSNRMNLAGSFGGSGSTDGKFNGASDAATDAAGNVYVSDYNNYRVQKFSPTGAFLGKFGSRGAGDGQFGNSFPGPGNLAVSKANGHVLVVDRNNRRVEEFTSSGVFVRSITKSPAFTSSLTSVDTDAEGNIFILDDGAARVFKFSALGEPAGGFPYAPGTSYMVDMAVGHDGGVYLCGVSNGKYSVQRYSLGGSLLSEWEGVDPNAFHFIVVGGGTQIKVFDQDLNYIGVDLRGNVIVADYKSNSGRVYTSTGGLVGNFGSGLFSYLSGLGVDALNGKVYLADYYANVVKAFATSAPAAPSAVQDLSLSLQPDGSLAAQWTAPGAEGDAGTASSYDLRYSTMEITESNFLSAAWVPALPAPEPAGTPQTAFIDGLAGGATVYLALRSFNSLGAVSGISNVPGVAVPYIVRSQKKIGLQPEVIVLSGQPLQLAQLAGTSGRGLDVGVAAASASLSPVSGVYDLLPEGALASLATGFITIQVDATRAAGFAEGELAMYILVGEGLVRLPGQSYDPALARFTAELSIAAPLGVFGPVEDVLAPVTSLQVESGPAIALAEGGFLVAADTRLRLVPSDPVSKATASGVATTLYSLNGGPDISYGGALTFDEGINTLRYHSSDRAGNVEVEKSSPVLVDATAPGVFLVLREATAVVSGMDVASADAVFDFVGVDKVVAGVGSGIGAIETSLNGAPFALQSAPVGVALGTGELAFRGRDRVGNQSPEGRVVLSKPPWPAKGYSYSTKFGAKGPAEDQFSSPNEIVADLGGNLIVSDSAKKRIFKFSRSGQLLVAFGGPGSGPGQFGSLFGQLGLAAALDAGGNVYAADNGNHRIQKFSPEGLFLGQISTAPVTGASYFGTISDLKIDADGNIWVLNAFRNLLKFNPEGALLGTYSLGFPPTGRQFSYSFSIALDGTFFVHVQNLDSGSDSVYVYDNNVALIRQWTLPAGVPVVAGTDFFGNVIVARHASGAEIYSPAGALVAVAGLGGAPAQNVGDANGAYLDPLSGRLYIADAGDGDIKVFDVDQTPPDAPVVITPTVNPLRTFTPLIAGRAEADSLVTVTEGGSVLVTTRTPTNGIFQARLPAQGRGIHQLSLGAADRSGNVSPTTSLTVDLQPVNPAAFSAGTTVKTNLYVGQVKTVAAADFTGDGTTDVLAFGRTGYQMFRGLANGGFAVAAARQDSLVLDECQDAATGDINGDGFTDAVALCRFDASRIAAVLGTGAAAFGAETTIFSGTPWTRLILSDWNGDGIADILAAQPNGTVAVFIGGGAGIFQAPLTLASVGTGSGPGLVAADFDGDGNIDLAAGNHVLFGDGHGGVAANVTLPGPGSYPAVADFNRDGKPDIWTTTFGQFAAYLNLGAREFAALETPSGGFGGSIAPQSADFNRDGIADAFVEVLQFVSGSGDGGPGAIQAGLPNTGGNIKVLDVDGDGLPDVVKAANEQSLTSFVVHRNLSGPPDVTPPSPITDIVMAGPVAGTLEISWTAPGDDGDVGTAASYDIRLASYPIDDGNFASVQNPDIRHAFPAPAPAGTRQTATFGGFNEQLNDFQALPLGVTFYVRVEAVDEVDNGTIDGSHAQQAILGADLAISTVQVRFVESGGSLVLYACPENKGPAISPVPEIAIVAGPSSGTPNDLAGLFWTDNYFHFPPGDCRQGTDYSIFDAGDEFARSFPMPGPGRHEFGVYLRMYPAYVPAGLDPDPANDSVHVTVGIGSDAHIDDAAPAAVTDLVAGLQVDGRILLSWTAPGDDESTGTAKSYEIRSATHEFTAADFESQTLLNSSVPAVVAAGGVQTFALTDFPQGATAYFAVRAYDDAENPSAPSNVIQAQTPFVATSPAPEVSAAELTFVSSRPVTVEPIVQASTAGAVILAAAGEQGLTSASGLFEIGPDGAFDPPATLIFRYSTGALAELGLAEADIAVYEFFFGQGWVRLANQTLDAPGGRIIVSLSAIGSQFGVFGVVQDRVAPTTALRVAGGTSYAASDGAVYRSSGALYGFLAEDPVVYSTSSGVAFTEYRLGASTQTPFQRFASDFPLPEGLNLVSFRSQDHAGNLEVERSSTVLVDATPPVTTLSVAGPQGLLSDGVTLAVSSLSTLALSAQDPEREGLASGLRETLLGVDTTTLSAQTADFVLEEPGPHLLRLRSVDQVLNEEELRSVAVVVDSAPPAVAIVAPAGGSRYVARGAPLVVDFSALDAYDPAPSSAAFLVRLLDRGSPAGERPGVVPVRNGQSIAALDLDDGVWELRVSATDFVRNAAAAAGGAFEVLHDVLPPRTALAVGTPRAEEGPGGTVFVTRETEFALVSVDDLVALDDAIGLGVARQDLSVDGADRASFLNPDQSSATFRSTFTLLGDADGLRLLAFRAADALANAESVRVATVAVDNTAPLTFLALSGGRQAPGGEPDSFYASTDTVYALTALDPDSGGVAAGLGATFRKINEGAPIMAASTFTLNQGRNALAYWSQDRLQNLEVARTTTALVDGTPPVSAFAMGSPSILDEGGVRYISSSTLVALSAVDPALPDGTAGSGLDRIEAALDNAPFTVYTSSLTFPEGRHTLRLRALDRVGVVESVQSLELHSDASAPRTSLAVLGGLQAAGPEPGSFYASSDTRIALPAVDPVAAGVASGLKSTDWQDNGGTFQAYSAPLAFGEGAHQLSYRSSDRVANAEVLRSTTILIDATAPRTAFVLGTPSFVDSDGTRYVTPATLLNLAAADPTLPGGTAGSGVADIEVSVDGGTFAVYSAALTFAQGRHVVLFRAVDSVGNAEAAQTLALRSDAVAPETSLAVQGGQQDPGPDAASFYASADSRFALLAADPGVADVASGVDLTRWREGEGAFQTYSAPIALAEGSHLLAYQSLDRVANLEVLRSTTVLVDATAPRSSFTIGAPAFVAADGTRYVAPGTQVSFSAEDPTLPGGTAGSGVARIEVAVDGGQFAAYFAALTFPEGRHTVQFRALDRVGNVEAAQTLALHADATPPLTTLSPSGAYYSAEGRDYAPAGFTYTLPAQDPVVSDVASGVAETLFALDAGATQAFAGPFTLAEGIRAVTAHSRDNVANLEQPRTSTVHVDATAPQTALGIQGGRQAAGPDAGSLYASPDTRFVLPAVDPQVSGVASGVDLTRWQDNGGALAAFAAPIALGEGSHLLAYQSQDHVANLEVLRSNTVLIDATAPQTAFQTGSPAFIDADGTRFVTPATPVSFTAADPSLSGGAAGSGVERIEVSVDGADYVAYAAALTFPEGRHVILFRAVDRVGNLEAAQTLALRSDASTPLTSLAIQGGRQTAGPDAASFYASPDTRFALQAADPVVADVAAGLESTRWQDNGGAFQAYGSPISLAEGSHLLAYQSQDKVQNLEVQRSTTVRIDATAPLTAFNIGTPSYTDAVGVHYITPTTPLTFTAQDPALPGGAAGAGVERVEVAVDGGAFATYATALTFPEGRHTVQFRAVDRVGNIESIQTLALRSDATAPQTTLAAQGGVQVPGEDSTSFYASADTRFALSSGDPVVSDVASGVEFTRWQDNGAAFLAYDGPFSLSEGVHQAAYQSQDRVANLEVLRSTTILIDATAPETVFSIGSPSYVDGTGLRYVTPATPVSFSAQDPGLPGGAAGSGIDRIEIALDGGSFEAYSAAIALPEGRHSIRFRALDRVGNVEEEKSLEMRSDASAPESSLAIQGGTQAPEAAGLYASGETRLVLSAEDPTAADVASGLDSLRWGDNGGPLAPYSGPIALAGGRHVVAYQSQDKVLNLEVLRSTTLFIDATPPQTAFSIGTPAFTGADGTRYITPATPVSFSAQDPALAGGSAGSGVARIEIAVDGAAFAAYATPLTFPEGRHTVQFRALDRVGNIEATQTLSLRSDATEPLTTFAAQGGRQASGPDAASFYASSDTRFALPATDPVVSDVASGVDTTRWQDNGSALQAYASPLALGEGVHVLAYHSQDHVANLEAPKNSTVLVDATPPVTQASFTGPRYAHVSGDDSVGGELFVAPTTNLDLAAQDPVVAGVASGLDSFLVSVDGAPAAPWAGSRAFPQPGIHTVAYRGLDRVGNAEPERTLSLAVDAAPPATTLSYDGPAQERTPGTAWLPPEVEVFVTPATRLILTAYDQTVQGLASGAKLVRYRVDSGPWLVYAGTFTLSNQGLHVLEFAAEDRVGNLEPVASRRIAVDSSGPLASSSYAGPALDAFGLTLLSTAATVSLSAADPAGAGVAVGVSRIYYFVDGGGAQEYSAPFSLAVGSHTVSYHAVDLLGNAGPTQTLAVRVLRFLGGSLSGKGGIQGSGASDIAGLLQTDGELSFTGSVTATGGAEAFSINLKGASRLSGPVVQGVKPLAADDIDLGQIDTAVQAQNDNALLPPGAVSGGVLRLNAGQEAVLATGTYLLEGLELNGGSKLRTAGPVRLFVRGAIKVNGGASLNEAGPAKNLAVFGTATSAQFSAAGFSGVAYLPGAALEASGGLRLGGCALAGTVDLSGDANATAPGLEAAAPAPTNGGGKGGKLAAVSEGGAVLAAGPADASFALRDLYAFPNPAVGGAKPTIHVAVGVADRVTVRIFDVSGQIVNQRTLDGTPGVIDDGSGAKYAYEYAWDGHIPSGVYFYTVTAEKSGQPAIRKVGKLAVVR